MDKALEKAKRNDEEKVGLNIKIPVSLKNEFDEICKKNDVSMTAMMLSLIEVVVDESKGVKSAYEMDVINLVNLRIKELESMMQDAYLGRASYDEDGHVIDNKELIASFKHEINELSDKFLTKDKK